VPVDQYRAGTAYPFATTLFRSREVQIVTEHLEECPVGIGHDCRRFRIYIQGDGCFFISFMSHPLRISHKFIEFVEFAQ